MWDEAPDWKKLEELKAKSVGHLLLRCARLWDEAALDKVNAQPGAVAPVIRPSHLRLFPHIAPEGTRPGEIAWALGISKQAVQQLVDELRELDVVEVLPDPVDGRARRVRLTERGRERIAGGLGVLAEVEAELTKEVGRGRMKALAELLREVTAALERRRG